MNLLGRLALLFVVVPILELVLLIQVGQWVGLPPTLLLVVFTGVAGAWLARAEGVRVFFQFRKELAQGKLPGQALLDALSVLVGGAFLLTPGILTDVAGFALLLPVTRRWIQAGVKKRLERGIREGTVRVVTMGPGGTWSGFSGAAGSDDEAAGSEPFDGRAAGSPPSPDPIRRPAGGDPLDGRDPSKGIEVGGGDDGP